MECGKPIRRERPRWKESQPGFRQHWSKLRTRAGPWRKSPKPLHRGEEVTTELNGQKLTITVHGLENMAAAFNVTDERRKALECAEKYAKEAVKRKEQYPSLVAECYCISTDDLAHMDMLHKQAVDKIEGKKRDGREVPASM